MHSFLLPKPTMRQVSQRKMIQSSALRLRLRLSQFKISSDTPALSLSKIHCQFFKEVLELFLDLFQVDPQSGMELVL